MSKFSDLLAGIAPFWIVDRGAFSTGDWIIVACKSHRDVWDVVSFVERETGLGGWLIRYESPYEKDGHTEWQLLR